MHQDNDFFESLLLQTSTSADFFRFCLSDQLPISLDKVIGDELDPIKYAGSLIESSFPLLEKRFAAGPLNKPLLRTWGKICTYDKLASVALFLRTSTLFPKEESMLKSTFAIANIYLLNVNEDRYPISAFGGLSHFAQNVKMHMVEKPKSFHNPEAIFLDEMIAAAGDSEDNSWFLWNPFWHFLLDKPRQAKLLRRFFHAAYSAFVMSNFEDCFKMTMDDLVGLMIDFTELQTDPAAEVKARDEFMERLRWNFALEQSHPGMELMLEAPFPMADLYYRECQGNLGVFRNLTQNLS